MLLTNAFVGILTASVLSQGVEAFWRLPCRQRLSLERVDPIDTFGDLAHHVHTIHGANNFAKGSSCDDLRNSTCSSCMVKQDMSAYWTPNLYYQHANGQLVALNQTGGMLVYYLLRGENIKPFPADLRLIAGEAGLRNYTWPDVEKSLWESKGLSTNQKFLAQQAIGFNCLNYAEPAKAALGLRRIPENWRDCKDGLRAEVFFPSCWDGKRSDCENHRRHVLYPTMMDSGKCPHSHPVRIPSLFFETIWNVGAVTEIENQMNSMYSGSKKGRLVFSNGDATGLGYHGDFMNGWQQDVLKAAIKDCTDPSGVIEKCKHFEFFTPEEYGKCTKPAEIDEDVWGPMERLPGCNEVTEGPYTEKEGGCQLDAKKPKKKPHKKPIVHDAPRPVKAPVAYSVPRPDKAPVTYSVHKAAPKRKAPMTYISPKMTKDQPAEQECEQPKKKKKVHVKVEMKYVTETRYKYVPRPMKTSKPKSAPVYNHRYRRHLHHVERH